MRERGEFDNAAAAANDLSHVRPTASPPLAVGLTRGGDDLNLFSSLDLVLCALSAYVGANNLNYFLRIRSEKERLHFSLACISTALYAAAAAGLYASDDAGTSVVWQRLQFFFSTALVIEFLNFTYCLLGRKSDVPHKIFAGISILCIGSGILFGGYILDERRPLTRVVRMLGASAEYVEHTPGPVWNVLLLVELIGMGYLYILLIREYRRGRSRALLPLLLGFLAFFASVIVDILTASDLITSVYTAEYAFFLLILVMDNLLLQRFIRALRDVEDLNLNLGEKVRERTSEIQDLADELKSANAELKVKNEELTVLAERDGMTELLNHEAFHRRFSELFNLARRHSIPVTVMLMDIDRFKSINDRFGHQAGDEVIRKFAETLKSGSRNYDLKARYKDGEEPAHSALRNYDLAGRYGGDEFAIALPYCGALEARIVADRICAMVRGLRFEEYPELKVSASIGCAVLADPSLSGDEPRVIRLADRALYEAKERGRDNAVIRSFGDEIEELAPQ
jgi:GGDEF domain-containing protein